MTAVFFLFLFHSALGLMAALAFVPEAAGDRFFKFCSATAAFMATAGIWLLVRRYGLRGGPEALAGETYPLALGAAAAALGFMVLYNRARLFGWGRLTRPFLGGALLAGVGAVVAGAPEGARSFVSSVDLCSALLIGASAGAMILGHWYLVVLDLPISALRRLTVLLAVGLVLRGVTVAVALLGPVTGALDGARAVAVGLWSPDGIFVWMRLLFGIAAPASLIGFIWKTVEIRSTQSATGILYVQLFLVMSGELLAKYLRVAAGFPL
jgi:hypothetical protein